MGSFNDVCGRSGENMETSLKRLLTSANETSLVHATEVATRVALSAAASSATATSTAVTSSAAFASFAATAATRRASVTCNAASSHATAAAATIQARVRGHLARVSIPDALPNSAKVVPPRMRRFNTATLTNPVAQVASKAAAAMQKRARSFKTTTWRQHKPE